MSTTAEVELVDQFLEFGYEDGFSLKDMRGKGTFANKQAVLDYLKQGKTKMASPGLIPDPFAVGKYSGSYSIRTDGRFAWHDALEYFVQNYDVPLPAEFVEHMARNGFRVPEFETRSVKIRFE